MPTARYKLEDGTRVPGTTTIIGRFKDSGGLLHWAFRQGQDGANHLYEKAEEAADIGTMAHALVEADLNDEDVSALMDKQRAEDPEKATKAESAFREYLEWAGHMDFRIVSQEENLVSEEYRFGGTPDAVAVIGNELCLLDWKTSNKVYPDYLLQLAAYRILWNENHPDNPVTGPSYLVRFAKDFPDFEVRKFGDLEVETEQFLALRDCYERDKLLKARVK